MYKLILTLVLAVFMLQVGFAGDESYKVDVQQSKLEWLGKKVTGEHNGTINLKSGSLQFKEGKLAGGDFEVDMTSLLNQDLEDEKWNTKLVNHLKSEDFFHVEQFPTATLKITEVKEQKSDDSDANYWVKADLTIKGKTNPVEFATKVVKNESGVSGYAEIVVDRAKYDVRYGSGSFFEGLGDRLIYDDFNMKVTLNAK